jgi:hypothetical protein
MTSRCMTYNEGGCLIEAFATDATPGALHVARLYFVDRAEEGAIVRPIIDLDGRPLSIFGTSAAAATRAARKYLRKLFGAPDAVLRQCGLGNAALGAPVTVADCEPAGTPNQEGI